MENSGNLKSPSVPVLLNVPSVSNFNVYKDTVSGLINLVLPQHGKSIPLGADTHVSVTLPNIATKKVGGVTMTGIYPNDPVNYEYGLTIEMLRKQPGVDNDEYWPLMFHLYSKLNTLQVMNISTKKIELSDQYLMVQEIVRQANLSQTNEEFNLPDILEVGYKYMITIALGADLVFGSDTLTVTNIQDLVKNTEGWTFIPLSLNETPNPDEWTGILMVPYSKGLPNAATFAKITSFGLYFKSKTEVWDWNVKIDEVQWENNAFSYLIYPTLAAAADLNHRINIGAETFDFAGNSYDTNAEVAAKLSTFSGVVAFGVDDHFTTAYVEDKVMTVYPLPTSTQITSQSMGLPPANTTSYTSMASKTVWKQLTADQVFKTFTHMAHLGELSTQVRHDVPLDEDYVKITLVHKGHIHASMHSASGYGFGEQRLQIYMPKSKFYEKIYATASSLVSPIATGSTNSPSMLMNAICTSTSNLGYATAEGSWKDFTAAIA